MKENAKELLPYTLVEYREATSGAGPLASLWKEQPHRLVFDLVKEAARLRLIINSANDCLESAFK